MNEEYQKCSAYPQCQAHKCDCYETHLMVNTMKTLTPIPRADEVLKNHLEFQDPEKLLPIWKHDNVIEAIKDYGNMVREATLKAASQQAVIVFHEKGTNEFNRGPFRKSKQESIFIDTDSILNAFPKELIQ